MVNNNFIIETPDMDNLPEHRIVANSEFIFNVFIGYIGYYMLSKEEFVNEEINFKEEYIPETEDKLKFEQYFKPSGVSKFDNINNLNPFIYNNIKGVF